MFVVVWWWCVCVAALWCRSWVCTCGQYLRARAVHVVSVQHGIFGMYVTVVATHLKDAFGVIKTLQSAIGHGRAL